MFSVCMDDATLAIMARVDNVRDDVTDLKISVRSLEEGQDRHEETLKCLSELAKTISIDIKQIKAGPVYSLDRFITLRVAQFSGGLGLVGVLLAFAFGII